MSAKTPVSRRAAARRRKDLAAKTLFLLLTVLSVAILFVLLYDIVSKGLPRLSSAFFTNFPSHSAAKSGIASALAGSLWLIGLTALISLPLGLLASIHLEEYARDSRLNRIIKLNIANLAGIPSIVYGIFGLYFFVRTLALGRSLLAGAFILSLLVLPILILSSSEAIRAVPQSLRHAAYALGATKMQTLFRVVLPRALPGILTGVILSLSRALGETAPLLLIGAFSYVAFLPKGPLDAFTALPIQIYVWSDQPQAAFKVAAAAAILVLLVVLLLSNLTAILIRNRYSRQGGSV
jgi:phosphate transport system permease protein